jgi:hypothetical protein
MLQNGIHDFVGTYTFGKNEGTTAGRVVVDSPYVLGIATDDGGEYRKILLGMESNKGIRLIKLSTPSTFNHGLVYALRHIDRQQYAGHWARWNPEDESRFLLSHEPLIEAFSISEQEAIATLYDAPRELIRNMRRLPVREVRRMALGTGAVQFTYVGEPHWSR